MTDPHRPAANALAQETSPYLLQHAHNPVRWYPWGDAALERARSENKPILLSVGYSACHWCHVMAHESFEDAPTARLMNELYVNIKVDREERPDIDKIYQTAHQLLTQRGGGWPLTMFLTPDDHKPFFGGTYFPREARHGLPAFKDILARVSQYYGENETEIRAQNERLTEALVSMEPVPGHAGAINPGPLAAAVSAMAQVFDSKAGGFGRAPKFPHGTNLERLLRDSLLDAADAPAGGSGGVDGGGGGGGGGGRGGAIFTKESPRDRSMSMQMAAFTLEKMALGGVYDQLGGGFCRYSTDDEWMIPHFEKMLYDNGPLLALCAQTYQYTGKPVFERVAGETAEWIMREMQAPCGGYYSTLDADSEGEEGRFYVWTPDEVRTLLSPDEFSAFAPRFGLDRPANFEGRWHLHAYRDIEDIAGELGAGAAETAELLDGARAKLLACRSKRVWPGRDEKVLTSWNALAIKGMAIAGRALGRGDFVDSAARALDFVRKTMFDRGRLLATYKDGHAHLNAYLDDHAFLLDAILSLLECRFSATDLELAMHIADALLARFEDERDGGFYFTSNDHETLIVRNKPLADDAMPAGNGVASYALARLGHLIGEQRYLDAAQRCIELAWPHIDRIPHAHNAMLLAVEEYLYPPQTVVLRGEPDATAEWRARADIVYAPRRLLVTIEPGITGLPALLSSRAPCAGAPVTAYVCQGTYCEAPTTDFEEYSSLLLGAEPKGARA